METAKTETAGALVTFSWTPEREALLKRTLCRDATDDEFALFLGQCKRTGLDPFSGQIHGVSRNNRATGKKELKIQTGIDGFRLNAQRTGEYEGQVPKQWCGSDGVWTDIWLLASNPMAARAGVWRKGFREPLYAVALWDEYAQTYTPEGGQLQLTKFWASMDAHMLAKCAEALALRQAFPQELSGLYLKEELHRKEVNVDAVAPAPRRASDPPAPPAPPAPPEAEDAMFSAGEPTQAPGPATGPTPAPAPPPEPPAKAAPQLPNSAGARAPEKALPPPAAPPIKFVDTVNRFNSKDMGRRGAKFGICSGSGKWSNTFDEALFARAKRLAGTNISATFVCQQTAYGLDLLDLIEIPPGGLK